MVICPECHAENKNESSYCAECGAKLEKYIVCPACGRELACESKFCTSCGASVNTSDMSGNRVDGNVFGGDVSGSFNTSNTTNVTNNTDITNNTNNTSITNNTNNTTNTSITNNTNNTTNTNITNTTNNTNNTNTTNTYNVRNESYDVVKCEVCGNLLSKGSGNVYECRKCGICCCGEHFDSEYMMCSVCAKTHREEEARKRAEAEAQKRKAEEAARKRAEEERRRRAEEEAKIKLKKERAKKRAKRIKGFAVAVLCLLIAFVAVLGVYIIPDGKYGNAVGLMNEGKYAEAIPVFESVKWFKDSGEQIRLCKYNYGLALINEGKLDEAYGIFSELGDYKDSAEKKDAIEKERLKNVKVGDNIFFGKYEQDNNTANGKEDIEWTVLEVKNGKALVISKYALDCKLYHEGNDPRIWETCTLRKWLNGEFLNSAFSADEKDMIPTVTVTADKNPAYDTDPGRATRDKVFLLSITEANKYFASDAARRCKPTESAVSAGAHADGANGNCWWLLRTSGYNLYRVSIVNALGDVLEYGVISDKTDNDSAIRPAMWIDLNF